MAYFLAEDSPPRSVSEKDNAADEFTQFLILVYYEDFFG